MFNIKPNGIISNAQYPKALAKAIELKNKLLGTVSVVQTDVIEDMICKRGPVEYVNTTLTSLTNCYVPFKDASFIKRIDFLALESCKPNTPLCNCASVIEASFPKLKEVGDGAFAYAKKLAKLHVPNLEAIHKNSFLYDDELKTLHLPKCTLINTDAFYYCGLENVILSGNEFCALGNGRIFSHRMDANATLTFYVPNALYGTYAADAKWAQFFDTGNLLPIEPNLETVNNLLIEIGEPIIE